MGGKPLAHYRRWVRLLTFPAAQFENSLRRHNHIGLAYGLLYALASVGALDEATTMAKEKLKLRRQKAAKEGLMEED